jgi:hypothetical protein
MRRLLLLVFVAGMLLVVPSSAMATTCSAYSNQAAAQRAADTRDADGDGIYCESLPCPCLKPGGGSTSPPPPPAAPPPPPAQETTRCGVERWSVKTLTDSRASRVSFVPRVATVDELRDLAVPAGLGRNAPRLPGEFSTYRVKVRLRSMKIEDDSDIHLVVADPTNAQHTIIVEFPNAGCVRKAGPTSRRRMARARAGLMRSCGPAQTGSFRLLTGTATITGVAFFDVIHGQRGVAPNGIELHPALSFTTTSSCTSR